MSAILQAPRPASVNRRRRVRQKVHAPAYASFVGDSQSEMLNLYEILDISEVGLAIQGTSQMEIGKPVDLCLDLAESSGTISATARVVWSDPAGRVGFGLPVLPDAALHRLREWLFLNSMAGAANAASAGLAFPAVESTTPSPSYTDTLAAASAVQREAESLGADLGAVLSLIASRSQSLLRASGAAIALAGTDAGIMICRASAGPSAPPVGVGLQVGSGFSGECVRTGETLRCDDAETDKRVDRESCRSLGIRSMLAAPIRSGEKVVGLLETFSADPNAFSERDSAVLQRFAESIVAAAKRAAPVEATPDPVQAAPAPPEFIAVPFSPRPGSVLFASEPEVKSQQAELNDELADRQSEGYKDKVGGVHLPRTYLFLLILVAAIIALALGFLLAPRIQPWIQNKFHVRRLGHEQTVLASSRGSVESAALPDSSRLEGLRALAQRNDPTAENAIGLLYAQGDESQSIKRDSSEAAHWFTRAAEHGSISAQYKLALLYWGGHGVPKDANKAYFWAVLARAGGQEGSKDLAKVLANGMTRAQAAAIEQQAEIWYQDHESHGKPQPGR